MRIYIILLLALTTACTGSAQQDKMKGISFVAGPRVVNDTHVQPVVDLGANSAAIMPFAYIHSLSDNPEIFFNRKRQWESEKVEGARSGIQLLQKSNISIMLKPQLWVRNGEFTGRISMNNEEDWKELERTYSGFILLYAQLAQDEKVDIYCIGTELEDFVKARPEFWKQLIVDVKKIYKGKLTYAENWDAYTRVPFIDQLDYIGVDAYFPVSEATTPTVEEAKQGWLKWKEDMVTLSRKHKKPILFTEYGYRSIDYSGKEPWQASYSEAEPNYQAQMNLLQAAHETFWKEEWFAGGYLWKWFPEDPRTERHLNRFTPQGKPTTKHLTETFYKSE